MSLYQLEQMTRVFDNRTVLSIDHLEIEPQKIYALLGPNGAGKTTLINILGFLDFPTSGRIRFEGTALDHSRNRLKQFRRHVVVVSQRPVLFSTSVYKNMEFGLKIKGVPLRQRASIIQDSLELVGMRHLIKAPATKLSGGETQRIVLARALALSPRIIICDEPTSSIDMESQIAVMNLLRTINREKGITIIISSHDRQQSTRLAHEVLFLDRGKLFDGAYENMFSVSRIKQTEGRIVYALNGGFQIQLSREIEPGRRVLLDPWKIQLATDEAQTAPAGSLSGEIIGINREKEAVRLVLNSEIQLVLKMTAEAYQARKPLIGEWVTAQISDEAVQVI